MSGFIAWCGFAGAWLLFAGPTYQAVLELHEQDLERDRINATQKAVAKPDKISGWWWLLPPVHYLLSRGRTREYRRVVMAALDPTDMQNLIQYMSKAIGWLLVGTGGLLLAITETWQLTKHYEWPVAVFWVIAAVMVLLSASYAAVNRDRRGRMATMVDAIGRESG